MYTSSLEKEKRKRKRCKVVVVCGVHASTPDILFTTVACMGVRSCTVFFFFWCAAVVLQRHLPVKMRERREGEWRLPSPRCFSFLILIPPPPPFSLFPSLFIMLSNYFSCFFFFFHPLEVKDSGVWCGLRENIKRRKQTLRKRKKKKKIGALLTSHTTSLKAKQKKKKYDLSLFLPTHTQT